jgi:hypothetical protein
VKKISVNGKDRSWTGKHDRLALEEMKSDIQRKQEAMVLLIGRIYPPGAAIRVKRGRGWWPCISTGGSSNFWSGWDLVHFKHEWTGRTGSAPFADVEFR